MKVYFMCVCVCVFYSGTRGEAVKLRLIVRRIMNLTSRPRPWLQLHACFKVSLICSSAPGGNIFKKVKGHLLSLSGPLLLLQSSVLYHLISLWSINIDDKVCKTSRSTCTLPRNQLQNGRAENMSKRASVGPQLYLSAWPVGAPKTQYEQLIR